MFAGILRRWGTIRVAAAARWWSASRLSRSRYRAGPTCGSPSFVDRPAFDARSFRSRGLGRRRSPVNCDRCGGAKSIRQATNRIFVMRHCSTRSSVIWTDRRHRVRGHRAPADAIVNVASLFLARRRPIARDRRARRAWGDAMGHRAASSRRIAAHRARGDGRRPASRARRSTRSCSGRIALPRVEGMQLDPRISCFRR